MHGLTARNDGSVEMMSVGPTLPWHKLGVLLPDIATGKEAMKAAQLDWKVKKTEMMHNGEHFQNHYFVERMDNGKAIGICGKEHALFQNEDLFEFMDEVTMDPNGPKYVTAGSLKGGQRVWMLAKLPQWSEIVPKDRVDHYLLLSRGFYYESIRMMWTSVRVVCNNTLTMALQNFAGDNLKYRFSHRGDLSTHAIKAQDALGFMTEKVRAFEVFGQGLAQIEPSEEQVMLTLDQLFNPGGAEKDTRTRKNADAKIQKVITLAQTGMGAEMVSGTGWGWFNAVTEYVDHHYSAEMALKTKHNPDEYRFDLLLSGGGNELKTRASELFGQMIPKELLTV